MAKIHLGIDNKITLGNLDAERDWGYAPDYVKAMWMMLQQDEADDYVISTGKKHSIRDFLEAAFLCIGIKKFFRPAEVDFLIGDYSKAKSKFGWEPETSFDEMVKKMVDNDIRLNGEKVK